MNIQPFVIILYISDYRYTSIAGHSPYVLQNHLMRVKNIVTSKAIDVSSRPCRKPNHGLVAKIPNHFIIPKRLNKG